MDLAVEDLAKMIDHTRLKPETKHAKIKQLCEEAVTYGFVAVCINPVHVAYASELLKDTDVKVCSVIGFPLGANVSTIKAAEAREAVKSGAHEIDM
ncbi:MAG: deoxyribose-phosphate aldolase, partial [Candidatus Sifarchaeia archaeon]